MLYNCLVAIEKICRNEFDGDASQLSDVKHVILDKALDDVDVRFYCDLAIGMTCTEVGDELLKMAIDLYTTVHGNPFAKGFMEQYKQTKKHTGIKIIKKEIVLALTNTQFFFLDFFRFCKYTSVSANIVFPF